MQNNKGNLYLIPTPLGDNDHFYTLPGYNIQVIEKINVFIVEELKTARRFLRKAGYKQDFEEVTFHVLNEHTKPEESSTFLDQAKKGLDIGLLSEAGCPAIADPGTSVVSIAHQIGIKVIPLTGPSSIILALMASGLSGQRFTFYGYLPIKPTERSHKIKELDRLAQLHSETQIFIEAPYRNKQIIQALLETCNEHTLLCIATNISLPDESIKTASIREWRKIKPDPGKNPTVYLIG
ncbi:MAG TPA: SAM-dependent methyltransferase [Lentimicrobium sp.]|nr:SAM-dependent methyltransferase [Lentimicrobium sp.]